MAQSAHRKSARPWNAQAFHAHLVTVQNTIRVGGQIESKELGNQLLMFAKMLDLSLASNQKPSWRQEILPLSKLLCRYKDEAEARPALLVFLLSVKSACQSGWFQLSDAEDVLATLRQLFDSFTANSDGMGGSAATDTADAAKFFSSISHRYYPQLRVNSIFVYLEAKEGYEILVCDFQVPHLSLYEHVRLYVGRRDNMESSACLVTPSLVNFLVNGVQVDKRVTVGYVDSGPQMPTDVTNMVKVGANVLQVIGEFSVPHAIAVASTTRVSISAANSHLQDHMTVTMKSVGERNGIEADDEVMEGPSRVSLRCPVSHQRMVTPVKATTCRHLQCFDYESFLEINERRPAWRCPCCNSCISWPVLQIDRQMEKVLQEADEKISEAMIFPGGSWVPAASREDKGSTGNDITSNIDRVEAGEGCRIEDVAVINLSDVDDHEELCNGEGIKDLDCEPLERKPDIQALQAALSRDPVNGSGMQASLGTSGALSHHAAETSAGIRDGFSGPSFTEVTAPAGVEGGSGGVELPNWSGTSEACNLPDITATGIQTSLGAAGPMWSLPNNRNTGVFLTLSEGPPNNGGRAVSLERQGRGLPSLQPAVVQAVQALPAPNQHNNFHLRGNVSPRSGSSAGPMNSLASNSGLIAALQQQQLPLEVHSSTVLEVGTLPRGGGGQTPSLQQQQQVPHGVHSSTVFELEDHSQHTWQRQIVQQVMGVSQNVEDLGQALQDRRGPQTQHQQHIHQFYGGSLQRQSLEQQQVLTNRSHLSYVQPQQGVAGSQQLQGARGGSPLGWTGSSSGIGGQVPGMHATTEQNWRPAARMRGSIAPGRGAGQSLPTNQSRDTPGSLANGLSVAPSLIANGGYSGGSNVGPSVAASSSIQGFYNGNWGSTPGFQSISSGDMQMTVGLGEELNNWTHVLQGPAQTGEILLQRNEGAGVLAVHTAEGWFNFENQTSDTNYDVR